MNNYKNGVFKANLGPLWYMGMYRNHLLTHKASQATYDAEFRKYLICEFPQRAWGEDMPFFSRILEMRDDPFADPAGFSAAYYAAKG